MNNRVCAERPCFVWRSPVLAAVLAAALCMMDSAALAQWWNPQPPPQYDDPYFHPYNLGRERRKPRQERRDREKPARLRSRSGETKSDAQAPPISSANPYHGKIPSENTTGTVVPRAETTTPPVALKSRQTAKNEKWPASRIVVQEPQSWHEPKGPREIRAGKDLTAIVWSDSDSLAQIAKACDTASSRILEMNSLQRGELSEGQALRVPSPKTGLSAFEPERQMRREITQGIRGRSEVALTFDAGGEVDGARELLETLRSEETTATFFITGQFAKKNPEIVREIARDGHAIHNHSWSHPDFRTLPDEAIASELGKTDQIVRDICGKETLPFWRPPYGERDRRVLDAAARMGYQSVYWTLDSLDSYGEPKTAEFLANRVLNPPNGGNAPERALDGAIILMHVGEISTAEAVPQIIRGLRAMGFEFVTVDELLTP